MYRYLLLNETFLPSKYNISKRLLWTWLFKLPSSSSKCSRLCILIQNLNMMIIEQSRMVHFMHDLYGNFWRHFSTKKRKKKDRDEIWDLDECLGNKSKKIKFLRCTIGVQTGRSFFRKYCTPYKLFNAIWLLHVY